MFWIFFILFSFARPHTEHHWSCLCQKCFYSSGLHMILHTEHRWSCLCQECFHSSNLHMTLECRDTKLWPVSGCITMSLILKGRSQQNLYAKYHDEPHETESMRDGRRIFSSTQTIHEVYVQAFQYYYVPDLSCSTSTKAIFSPHQGIMHMYSSSVLV